MTDNLDRLVGRIYELGVEAEAWPMLIDEIASHFGCVKATYTHFDHGDAWRSVNILRHPDIDSAKVQDALGLYHELPPGSDLFYAALQKPPLRNIPAAIGHKIVDHETFLNGRYYREVLTDGHMFDHLLMPIVQDGFESLLTLYTDGPGALFTDENAAAFARIRPHIVRMASLQSKLGHKLRLGALASSALDALNFPLLLAAPRGKILLANKRAQLLLSTLRGLLERRGNLVLESAVETERLRALLAKACGIGGRPVGGGMAIKRCDGNPLAVQVYPFEQVERSLLMPPLSVERCALVVVSDPDDRPVTDAALWSLLFGLTAAETEIGRRLILGDRQKEIAAHLRISENTMRWHVKSMLRKTLATRESHLILNLVEALAPIDSRYSVRG